MQRWEADEPRRPWIRRQYRDEEAGAEGVGAEEGRLGAEAVPPDVLEVDGRDFRILRRFRGRR